MNYPSRKGKREPPKDSEIIGAATLTMPRVQGPTGKDASTLVSMGGTITQQSAM